MSYEGLSREEVIARLRALEEAYAALELRQAQLEEGPRRLIHELQVHQLELETQNQALRESQAALEASRARYADLYDFAPLAYCTLDPDGVIVELNLTGATMFGVERAYALGKPFVALARMDDPAPFWAHLARSLRGAPAVAELVFTTARGRMEVQAVSTPMFGERGPAEGCRTAFLDIGPRLRAERALAAALESETELRRMLEALDRASVAVGEALARSSAADLPGLLQAVAEEARALAGAEYVLLELPESQFGRDHHVRSGVAPIPEEVRTASPVAEALAQAIEHGRTTHWRAPDAGEDAVLRSVIAAPIVCGEHDRGALCLVNKRGTDAFGAGNERALGMLAERLASTMEVARLREVEARERVRLRFLAQLGLLLAETIDDPSLLAVVVRAIVPELADACTIELAGPDGEGEHASFPIDGADAALMVRIRASDTVWSAWQEEVWRTGVPSLRAGVDEALLRAEVSDPEARELARELGIRSALVVPLSARGQPIGTLELLMMRSGRRFDERDVPLATEVAHLVSLTIDNARLYRAARDAIRARDEVLAVVAHDLRGPLGAAQMGARLLGESVTGTSERRTLELVARALGSTDRLIGDLLDVARIESKRLVVDPRPVAPQVLVSDAAEASALEAQAAGVGLRVEVEGELPLVLADRDRLAQVFSNVVGNAVKFTPSGGAVRVGAERSDGEVRFSITDSGPGADEEQLAHFFDRFWQAKRGDRRGAGLGLSIARGIVEAHGGRIWAESAPGSGTTVRFALPVLGDA